MCVRLYVCACAVLIDLFSTAYQSITGYLKLEDIFRLMGQLIMSVRIFAFVCVCARVHVRVYWTWHIFFVYRRVYVYLEHFYCGLLCICAPLFMCAYSRLLGSLLVCPCVDVHVFSMCAFMFACVCVSD